MEIVKSNESDTPRRVAHRLPCTVTHRGPANAGYMVSGDEPGLRSFRGRKLERGEFTISSTYEVFGAEIEDDNKIVLKYPLENHGIYYNHDDPATDENVLPKALRWMNYAAAIHAPVDVSLVESVDLDSAFVEQKSSRIKKE